MLINHDSGFIFFNLAQINERKASHTIRPPPYTHTHTTKEIAVSESLKLTVFVQKIVFPGGHLSPETAKRYQRGAQSRPSRLLFCRKFEM